MTTGRINQVASEFARTAGVDGGARVFCFQKNTQRRRCFEKLAAREIWFGASGRFKKRFTLTCKVRSCLVPLRPRQRSESDLGFSSKIPMDSAKRATNSTSTSMEHDLQRTAKARQGRFADCPCVLRVRVGLNRIRWVKGCLPASEPYNPSIFECHAPYCRETWLS